MKTKRLIGATTVALFALAITLFGCKKNGSATEEVFQPNFRLAKTSNELISLRKNGDANLVRTVAEFDELVKSSPLSKLPESVILDFRNGLVERAGVGIVSLKFDLIEKSLSYDDFSTVMGMFGLDIKQGYWGFSKDPEISSELVDEEVDGTEFADHKGYYCQTAHNCKYDNRQICLSGC
jgi:hypothetical protein